MPDRAKRGSERRAPWRAENPGILLVQGGLPPGVGDDPQERQQWFEASVRPLLTGALAEARYHGSEAGQGCVKILLAHPSFRRSREGDFIEVVGSVTPAGGTSHAGGI